MNNAITSLESVSMKKKKTTRKETTYFPVHKLSEMFGFVEATAFNTITGCLYGEETHKLECETISECWSYRKVLNKAIMA